MHELIAAAVAFVLLLAYTEIYNFIVKPGGVARGDTDVFVSATLLSQVIKVKSPI